MTLASFSREVFLIPGKMACQTERFGIHKVWKILLPSASHLEERLKVSQSVSRQASSQSGSQSGRQAGRGTKFPEEQSVVEWQNTRAEWQNT